MHLSADLEQRFPLDGPYDPDSVVNAASDMSELSRYLNYATKHADTLPYADSVHELAGVLSEHAGRLQQLYEQVARRVGSFTTDPSVYVADINGEQDSDVNSSTVAGEAAGDLEHAARLAEQLGAVLGLASQNLSRLGHHIDQEG